MIKRTVDDCGRVTIPPSIRKNLKISPYDTMDISQKGQMIIMQPCKSYCIICGGVTGLKQIGDVAVCDKCSAKIKAAK